MEIEGLLLILTILINNNLIISVNTLLPLDVQTNDSALPLAKVVHVVVFTSHCFFLLCRYYFCLLLLSFP